jgi:hypothetical protein
LAAASQLMIAGARFTLSCTGGMCVGCFTGMGHVCPLVWHCTGSRAAGQPSNLYYALLLLAWFTAGTVAVAAGVWLNDWWGTV